MSDLGDYIKNKRVELQLNRVQLAKRADISHTEIHRIENGIRQQPSYQVLCRLADALEVPKEELLNIAGYEINDNASQIEDIYPGLKTEKQKEVANKIMSSLSRNSNLKDDDLDDLYRQVEMFLEYKSKRG
ncbi:MAG: helix-turn-helix domain-containing protein [Acholeplasmatales bacterium]|nr:helix-turn-helix domain-containing protein [Acholeplasmatales bacterium]